MTHSSEEEASPPQRETPYLMLIMRLRRCFDNRIDRFAKTEGTNKPVEQSASFIVGCFQATPVVIRPNERNSYLIGHLIILSVAVTAYVSFLIIWGINSI